MDSDRQVRLLIPPFFFFASILLGTLLTENPIRNWVSSASDGQLLAVGGAIAGSLLPVGFAISTITYLLLRLAFLPAKRSFETHLSPEALEALWPSLRTTLKQDAQHTFNAAITLDHELLSSGMHSWVMRRWNVCIISAQACVALGLAHALACQLRLEQPKQWWAGSLSIAAVMAVSGVIAWRGTMGMLEFQAYRQSAPPSPIQDNAAVDAPPTPTGSGANPSPPPAANV